MNLLFNYGKTPIKNIQCSKTVKFKIVIQKQTPSLRCQRYHHKVSATVRPCVESFHERKAKTIVIAQIFSKHFAQRNRTFLMGPVIYASLLKLI